MAPRGLGKCQHCGAWVAFRRTVASRGAKWVSVDPAPSRAGTLALDGRGWVYVLGVEDELTPWPDDELVPELWTPHAHTCSAGADRHRQIMENRRRIPGVDD